MQEIILQIACTISGLYTRMIKIKRNKNVTIV